ncbi:MAG: cellulose synthase family protein, partial [Bacteroidota bacterium]
MEIFLIIIYSLFSTFIFFYSLVQLHLVYLFLRSKKQSKRDGCSLDIDPTVLPRVTVQLPIYNELYVVQRLIDAIAAFDYPAQLLEIQVLDDSTDETVALIAEKVQEWQAKGVDIQHIRRDNRKGFKAGALAYGLDMAQGELIAIFDADFLPRPDFLLKTVSAFEDKNIGVVQTRWEHLNEDYSLLTRLQAFALNAHFNIEQCGRNYGNHFINFNGTAGIWRKACILDAGGWSSDTLTEDLDLSYRAQLKGWKFKYLRSVGTPAELPVALNAMKTQQFRWTKGAAECTRKNLGKVWNAPQLHFPTKIHALFHLMNSFVFLCVIMISLLSLPMLWIKAHNPDYNLLFHFGSLFLVSLLILSYYYWVSFREDTPPGKGRFFRFLGKFVLFLAVTMGFSLHNAIAVFEGYIGKKTPFIRTPKFNVKSTGDTWKSNIYLRGKINSLTLIEGLLGLYFLFGLALGIYLEDYGLFPFHIMLSFGFSYIFIYSLV